MASADWWTDYFDAQYLLEYEPLFSPERDRREVARLVDVLGVPSGARILDVPCGQGRHAHLLAEAGFDVDGFDYSADLLARARKRGMSSRLRYHRGDMRSLPPAWTGRFDVVLNLFTSFGFFAEPADDRRVLAEFARVLKPGGVLVWHGASRDGVMARFLDRDWWQTSNGTLVAHERSFDALSGILTVNTVWAGEDNRGERGASHPPVHADASGRAVRRCRAHRRAGVRRLSRPSAHAALERNDARRPKRRWVSRAASHVSSVAATAPPPLA